MFVVCDVRVSLQRAVFSKLVKKNALYLTRERVGQVIAFSLYNFLFILRKTNLNTHGTISLMKNLNHLYFGSVIEYTNIS